jgi:sec-independent protein translocase protein TatA
MAGLTGWHLVILLAVVVLLFGAKRLPDMARAVGQSARIFKGEMKATAADEHTQAQHPPAASPNIEQPPHPVTPTTRLSPPPNYVIPAPQPPSDTTHTPTP